jgi:hypothetical protein
MTSRTIIVKEFMAVPSDGQQPLEFSLIRVMLLWHFLVGYNQFLKTKSPGANQGDPMYGLDTHIVPLHRAGLQTARWLIPKSRSHAMSNRGCYMASVRGPV